MVLHLPVTVLGAQALTYRPLSDRKVMLACSVANLWGRFHVTAIPIFIGFAEVGIFNAWTGLIILVVATTFGRFVARQVFVRIPAESIDAICVNDAVGVQRQLREIHAETAPDVVYTGLNR